MDFTISAALKQGLTALHLNSFWSYVWGWLSAAPIRLACQPMRYAHTAFVLALARVTTRAYGSLAPAIASQYAAWE